LILSSQTKNSAILSPWGGMPAFTQGMVTRHQFFEDTTAMKVAGTYKFKELIDRDLSLTLYHSEYEIGELNGYVAGHSWTAKESGFDLIYKASKELTLRFRGNYPTTFVEKADGTALNWDETRFIASYKF
jgi:imipenem/basic amino acid-specific outer membrane pore